jgi:hypothetical protein
VGGSWSSARFEWSSAPYAPRAESAIGDWTPCGGAMPVQRRVNRGAGGRARRPRAPRWMLGRELEGRRARGGLGGAGRFKNREQRRQVLTPFLPSARVAACLAEVAENEPAQLKVLRWRQFRRAKEAEGRGHTATATSRSSGAFERANTGLPPKEREPEAPFVRGRAHSSAFGRGEGLSVWRWQRRGRAREGHPTRGPGLISCIGDAGRTRSRVHP